MRVGLRFCLACLILIGGQAHGQSDAFPAGSGGVNADRHIDKPYVLLVSLDGFRWDYPDRFDTPAMRGIIEAGFRVNRLLPVFPTLTFPNHYAIATGLYPDRHGIVGNEFFAPELGAWYALRDRAAVEDGRFYSGEPIWVTAERQGMVSAAFFFVGSEADIGGIRPSHWRRFSKDIPGEQRVDQVLEWLRSPPRQRPHLVTLYFEHVDDQSHWSGVASASALDAVARVDGLLTRLMAGLRELPHGDRVNVIVISDHGQSSYDDGAEPLVLSEHIDLAGVRVVGKGSYAFLYYPESDPDRVTADRERLRAVWRGGRVLLPGEAPPEWRVGNNARWPDLMVLPNPGGMVVSDRAEKAGLNPGAHGWPPEFSDMHGVLFGSGPGFRVGAHIEEAHVVDLAPLVLELLDLDPPGDLDGDPNVFAPVRTRNTTGFR